VRGSSGNPLKGRCLSKRKFVSVLSIAEVTVSVDLGSGSMRVGFKTPKCYRGGRVFVAPRASAAWGEGSSCTAGGQIKA